MTKKNVSISSPEELNKRLQSTSFLTWIILGLISALLVGLFVWSVIFKLEFKITGDARVNDSGVATLVVKENDLNKLKEGQIVYINNEEGKIISFNEEREPLASTFKLDEGVYTFSITIEKRPISFIFGN